MEDQMKRVRTVLSRARREKDLSLRQVADAITQGLDLESMSEETVRQWEHGRRTPTIENLGGWANALGFEVQVLVVDPKNKGELVLVQRGQREVIEGFSSLSDEEREAVATLVRLLLARALPSQPSSASS